MGRGRVVRIGDDAADTAAVFFRDPYEQRRWQHHGGVAVSIRRSHGNAVCPVRKPGQRLRIVFMGHR